MFSFPLENKAWRFKALGLVITLVVLLHIAQDFIHSYHYRYSFYLSESLLFKTSWILFIPLISLFINVLQNKNIKKSYIFLSVLLFSVVHIFSFGLVVYLGSWLFFSHTYNLWFVGKETFTESFYLYVLIYTSIAVLYRYFQKQKTIIPETQKIVTNPDYLQSLSIQAGRKNVVVQTEDIYCICASSPYISIQTANQQYLYSSSLKDIHNKLNPNYFIRIHKSTILNIQKVVSYQSRLNGDYDITLQNQEVLRMSRNYTDSFKKYFSQSSS